MPRKVAHPLSIPWSPGRCCRSILGNFLDWLLWVCPPARYYEKMTAAHGCGALERNVGAWVGMEGCSTRWVEVAYTLKSQ